MNHNKENKRAATADPALTTATFRFLFLLFNSILSLISSITCCLFVGIGTTSVYSAFLAILSR